jgi:hypothetical protein
VNQIAIERIEPSQTDKPIGGYPKGWTGRWIGKATKKYKNNTMPTSEANRVTFREYRINPQMGKLKTEANEK